LKKIEHMHKLLLKRYYLYVQVITEQQKVNRRIDFFGVYIVLRVTISMKTSDQCLESSPYRIPHS